MSSLANTRRPSKTDLRWLLARKTFHGSAVRLDRLSAWLEAQLAQVSLSRLGVSRADKISTWTTREEKVLLFSLARMRKPNARVLEIGSYLGASACYLVAALALNNGRLVCVDTWQNETIGEGERDTLAEFEQNVQAIRPWITVLRKKSSELAPADVPAPLDMAFIDGDHSYQTSRCDFEKVEPLMARDSLIAFHDTCTYDGVSRTLGEVLASGRWMLGGHRHNLTWIVRPTWPVNGS